MEEESEYLKLPLENRCVHKLWKARVHGYKECIVYFAKITDEKSSEFIKFAPLMKKFATDSNAVALDTALEAVLVYVENAHIAGKTTGEVIAGIVSKCLAAPKKTTQDKALDVILMYCEIEKYEIVQEELIKGFSQKNPKVVAGCIRAVATALREFGSKVINIKSLVKCMGSLLEDRDKIVREEAKKMVVEMYRWVGEALKPQLTSLKPIQIQELEAEFEKMPKGKAVQTRFLRSQQELKAKQTHQEADEENEEVNEEEDQIDAIDPLDLMTAVNILEKLPKDFYEKVEAKKWQERKEAMDLLLPLSQNPKLEPGDYAELVKALKKIIGKDTNVMIIALAGQCLTGIAKGLKKKFSPYAVSCLETILEKFKEKKQNVVNSLRDAADAIFHSSTIEAIQEVACGALNNKNPSVKAETASFLARSFAYCTPDVLNKKLLKAYTTELVRTVNESDLTVRDNSAEAIGTLMKVVGEKILDPFINDIESLKKQKIKECCDKVELKVKIKVSKSKPAPKSAPPSTSVAKSFEKSVAPKAKVTKPITGGKRNVASRAGEGKNRGGGTKSIEAKAEEELSSEDALEKVKEVIPGDFVSALADANWKTRLSAAEDFYKAVQSLDVADLPTQAMLKTLSEKPGFKDNNFQVMKLKMDIVKYLAEKTTFTRVSADLCIHDLIEKLTDPKNGAYAGEILCVFSEALSLQLVAVETMNYTFSQKNPKLQEMVLKWLSGAIKEFGFVVQLKSILSNIKVALSQSNPNVRTAAVNLCGVIYLYMGDQLKSHFNEEKSSILQLIDAEFEKMSDESPPTPIRSQSNVVENGTTEEIDDFSTPANNESSRVNISAQITPMLISELADKNWKVRIEALAKVAAILNEAKYIHSDIDELPDAICARLSDTNKNIAAEALRITSTLAASLGEHCKRHTRTIIPGIFSVLGDTKQSMRQQALVALNNWVEHSGSVKDIMDGEMCIDALKSGSPFLKVEVISWMSDKLKDVPPKTISKDELNGCVEYIYSGLEDRNADIRRVSNEAIFPFMLHLGYEAMVKHSNKVKASSKNTVMQALEKAKPNLPSRPVQPQSKGRPASASSHSNTSEKPSSGVSKGGVLKRGGNKMPSTSKGSVNSSRKEEEVDNSPLLQVNNLKQQRIVEEQRMRTLRWDFQTPRPDFIAQLKDQMISASVNRQLIANMFHQDFKFHIKAIDALAEDLNGNIDACIANLDLILRWLTIRFFDTNPSVILKAMDYLSNIFTYLSENNYHLTEYEAYSFLPYLVMKFGDPKDSIRGPTRNIIKLICNIYPFGKVSTHIMDGLKSKNARQRAECLETMGSLIESYGISVCQPSPGAALKEVAKLIADRDNSVRNAALNCLLQVYYREGEKVYKLIGNISDKDYTLLEERIKRAAKNKPVIKKPQPVQPDTTVVKGHGGGGMPGRFNRVVPTPAAQPSPVVRDDSAFIPNENTKSFSSWSVYSTYRDIANSEHSIHKPPPKRRFRLPFSFGSLRGKTSSESLNNDRWFRKNSSSSNAKSFREKTNTELSGNDKDSENSDQNGNCGLFFPSIVANSSALEQARGISRSLSFVLKEDQNTDEELKDEEKKYLNHLPPLYPDFPPPAFTRTVTSPQFPGYGGQRPLSADVSKFNSNFHIDYEFMEKLLEEKIPFSRPKFELEEVPDISAVLNDKTTCPIPSSRFGMTSAMRANVANANINLEDASQAINLVISQVTTPDVNTVVTALSQLDEVIQSEERCSQLIPHIDQLLMVATVQYRLVLNTKMADVNIHKEECVRIYRSLTNCLMSIFNNKELGTRATRDVLHDVVHAVISILLDSRLNQLEDGPQIIRALNVLVVRIIEKGQFTHIFSALLKLLHESVATGVSSKFTELVMKCNWKGIRILPNKTNDLNPVQILQDTHDFMVAYPSYTWVDKPNNTPLRTVKTVLHNLVKIYGNNILTSLSKVPNTEGSEIQKYILKDLNSMQKSGVSEEGGNGGKLVSGSTGGVSEPSPKPPTRTPKKLNKDANVVLSDIFKKIGDKENTKEGLIQLYEFKEKHPEADIDSYLRKSSTFFQNYIERGLKKVEMERQCENVTPSPGGPSDGNSNSATPLSSIQFNETKNINVNELVDQFKAIAAQAGFDNTYIDSAVKDIYSTDKKGSQDVKDYLKSVSGSDS